MDLTELPQWALDPTLRTSDLLPPPARSSTAGVVFLCWTKSASTRDRHALDRERSLCCSDSGPVAPCCFTVTLPVFTVATSCFTVELPVELWWLVLSLWILYLLFWAFFHSLKLSTLDWRSQLGRPGTGANMAATGLEPTWPPRDWICPGIDVFALDNRLWNV